MPLNTASVGRATDFIEHEVDARWLMAYAASLGDLNPNYMDTAAGTVCAHPVFQYASNGHPSSPHAPCWATN